DLTDRLCRIQPARDLPHRADQLTRIDGPAHDNMHRQIWVLPVWNEELGPRLALQSVITDVTRDADDFVCVLAGVVIEHKFLADRGLAWPDFSGEAFADKNDRWCFGAIVRGEITTFDERDAERRQVFGCRHADRHVVGPGARFRFIGAPIWSLEVH